MIVKVQYDKLLKRALIYNEDRTLRYIGPLDEAATAALRGRPKAFFNAELSLRPVPMDHTYVVVLGHGGANAVAFDVGDEAPWQSW